MCKLRELLRHLSVILSMMLLVFVVLDQFNPMMNFVNNTVSLVLLAALCLADIALATLHWRAE